MEDNQKPIPNLQAGSFGKYISAIYRHSQILVSARLRPFGIGSGQYIFLLTIAANEGISQKALSQQLVIDKTTTAKAVNKLEALGFVLRKTAPKDNRYNLLYLTDSGKSIVPKVKVILDDLSKLSLAEIGDTEYRVMMDILQKALFNMRELVLHIGDFESL
jgi:DNA-binding MarR family transcriptional regulator